MTDWIQDIVQAAIYSFLKSIAQLTWGLDKAGLSVIELLDRFRLGLVQQGFTNALDTIAVEVIGLSRPVFELTLVAALLLIIIAPMIKLRWFDIRKVLLYAVLIPLLLPTVAAGFQDIDAVRGDLGSHFYTAIFSRTDFDLVPEGQPTGQTRDMGPLVPYGPRNDGQTGLRGVDVAAAYLFATREDVVNAPDRLPLAFKERYFRYTPEELENAPDAWAEIDTASEGITRSLYGFIIIIFAFLETVVNLGFSLILGFLLITLLLSILFAFAAPFEGLMISTIQNIVQLFMQSWAVSAMQALTLAAVIDIAENGNGTQVLGAGLLGLLLELMWGLLAYRSVLSAIGGLSLGGSSGGGDARAALGRLAGLASAPVAALAGGVAAAGGAGMAYTAAKRAGGSTAYARSYAAGTLAPFAKMGALASAMGWVDPQSDTGKGLYAGAVLAQGSALSMRGLQAMRRDVAQQQAAAAPGKPTPLTAPRIAEAIARTAAHRTLNGVNGSTAVARKLGVQPGAFGAKTRAVDRLVSTIRQHDLPPHLLQTMLLEASQEGGASTNVRGSAWRYLMQEQGLSYEDAAAHVDRLDREMRGMPTSLSAEDQARPGVRTQMDTSPFAHEPHRPPGRRPGPLPGGAVRTVKHPPPTLDHQARPALTGPVGPTLDDPGRRRRLPPPDPGRAVPPTSPRGDDDVIEGVLV